MYDLPYYKEKDKQVLLNFMRQHPFAMVIGCTDNLPAVTQIPLLIEERGDKLFIIGHFMRNTDHHKAFEQNANVLCVFTGAHTYVSASLYTNPQTASTWNYISVHARGIMRFLNHTDLLQALENLTNHYEQAHSPAAFHNLPKDYVERLSHAIIGFEIEVKEMDTVFKLSQNRDEKSYDNIVSHLKRGEADAKEIGDTMEKRRSTLFP